MSTIETHPFAHLGPAPYRYLGHTSESYQAVRGDPNCPIQPGGSCDHCGTGIYEIFRFRAADGTEFRVGSTCVEKADQKLTKVIAKDVAAHRVVVSKARIDERVERAVAAFPSIRATIAVRPHPLAWRAAKGDTLADWCDWMLANAGRKGRSEVAKIILAVG